MWTSINFLAAKFKSFEGLLSDTVRKICIRIEDFEQVHCYCELTSNLRAPKCWTFMCIYHLLCKMSGTDYLGMCSYLPYVYVIPRFSCLLCVFPGLNLFEKTKLLLNFFISQHNYVIRGSWVGGEKLYINKAIDEENERFYVFWRKEHGDHQFFDQRDLWVSNFSSSK